MSDDRGQFFISRHYTGTVRAYALTQEFTTPYTLKQNGLVERFFPSLKEECIWLHHFESLGQARVVIERWIRYYNEEQSHQSLNYEASRAHSALVTQGVQKPGDRYTAGLEPATRGL